MQAVSKEKANELLCALSTLSLILSWCRSQVYEPPPAPLRPRMPTPLVQTYTKGRSQGMVPRDEGSIMPKQVGLSLASLDLTPLSTKPEMDGQLLL